MNGPGSEAWWWFEATGDSHRYASFRASPKDSRASVQERVTAYHQNLLARRAAPPEPHGQWGRGRLGRPAKPGAPPGPPPPPPKTKGEDE